MKRLLTGLIMCLLGVLFLLDSAGLLTIRALITDYFPIIMIFIGVLILLTGIRAKPNQKQDNA